MAAPRINLPVFDIQPADTVGYEEWPEFPYGEFEFGDGTPARGSDFLRHNMRFPVRGIGLSGDAPGGAGGGGAVTNLTF